MAWVLQVASFKDVQRAEAFEKRLLDKGHRAFLRSHNGAQRVMVGPWTDKHKAREQQKQINRQFKLKSLLLKELVLLAITVPALVVPDATPPSLSH